MLKKLTVICENSVGSAKKAVGEHGFSCYVETDSGNFLFDTGQGAGFLRNSSVLCLEMTNLSGIILSHGHYDHAGGLVEALGLAAPVKVYAHPDIFADRLWVGEHEHLDIGIPFSRKQLEQLGATFDLSTEFREIAPGLWLTSVVLDSEKGLVLLLGCAHAGLVNIIRHVLDKTGRDRIYAVVGGLHLAPASDEQFAGTVSALKEFRIERIGVGHCTGQRRSAELFSKFPQKTFFASVGSSLTV